VLSVALGCDYTGKIEIGTRRIKIAIGCKRKIPQTIIVL